MRREVFFIWGVTSGTMECGRACHAIVFVILLSALSKGNSEDNPRRWQNWLLPPSQSSHMVNQDRTHYRKELVNKKQDANNVRLYVTNEFKSAQQMKQMLPVSIHNNEEGSMNWFMRYFELLLDLPNAPRRHLASYSDKPKPKQNVPAPAPSPLPDRPKPSSLIQPVTSNLFPVPMEPNPSSTTQPIPVNSLPVPSGLKAPTPSPHLVIYHHQMNFNSDTMQTVAAIAAALGGIAVLIALLLLCRANNGDGKTEPVVGKRDVRPLLDISPSAGSTEFTIGGGKLSSSGNEGSKLSGDHVLAMGEAPSPPLKPPPVIVAPAEAQAPPPPPPPRPKAPPPPPPGGARAPPMPPRSGSGAGGHDSNGQKARLKPFFWDKVITSPNSSMVWKEISAGSFVFNEEMMESLFGYASASPNKAQKKGASREPQYIEIIDKRKAQNLSILLRALNVTTEEVCDALHEGNELPTELISTLLKMPPTEEEELKLRSYTGDIMLLGPAERFLKTLIAIPFAFTRLECLLFMSILQEEAAGLNKAFTTLEVASKQLKNSRLFTKLLEAVLKTGNRMNDGTYRGGAHAFKLETLLKLSDVKGTDGKTNLLLFVVQEIIRSEGVRAAREASASSSLSSVITEDLSDNSAADRAEHYRDLGLEVVSGLSEELEDVKKVAVIDADSLMSTLSQLNQSLVKAKEFIKSEAQNLGEESDEFIKGVTSFTEGAEVEITRLLEEEKRIMALVKSTGDYFHGNTGRDEGLRLFVIVRDFLRMLDKVCREIKDARIAAKAKTHRKESSSLSSSASSPEALPQQCRRLFPQIVDRQVDSSSDEED